MPLRHPDIVYELPENNPHTRFDEETATRVLGDAFRCAIFAGYAGTLTEFVLNTPLRIDRKTAHEITTYDFTNFREYAIAYQESELGVPAYPIKPRISLKDLATKLTPKPDTSPPLEYHPSGVKTTK